MEDMSRPGLTGRSVDAAQGVAWWSEAWALFMKSPLMWVVFGLVVLIGGGVLHLVPLLGSLAAALLFPVLLGGWMLAARKVEQGGKLEFEDLFTGFKDLLSPLLMLGVAVLVCDIVITAVMAVLGLGAFFGVVGGASYHSAAGIATGIGFGLLALLVGLVLGFALAMLLWFAPPLVVFDGVPPIEAMKLSLSASLRNIGPFILFGLISIVLCIVAVLPAFLGLFVLVPLQVLAMYTSYRSVFGHAVVSAPPVA